MNSKAEEFEAVYTKLKEQDGLLWLRIIGETHWQFNELPFWVLLKDEYQIRDAIRYLQPNLWPLQQIPTADVTVSFITFDNNKECSHGLIKGERFFEESVFDRLYASPRCSPREKGVFDYEYPDDPWALKGV